MGESRAIITFGRAFDPTISIPSVCPGGGGGSTKLPEVCSGTGGRGGTKRGDGLADELGDPLLVLGGVVMELGVFGGSFGEGGSFNAPSAACRFLVAAAQLGSTS